MSTSKPFTDKQKASIFLRDRTTCCFSGANLWLLDGPLRVGWQSDWVDHISPKSRGGKAELSNGAGASQTYNMKKRNKLIVFQNRGEGVPCLEERRIIADPSETHKILLSIRECSSLNSLRRVVRTIFAEYRRNSQIWWEYFHPETFTTADRFEAQRKKACQKACKLSERLTSGTFASIQSDLHTRYGLIIAHYTHPRDHRPSLPLLLRLASCSLASLGLHLDDLSN